VLEIVYGETDQQQVASRLTDVLNGMRLDGSFYVGHPVIASAAEKVVVDGLLLTDQHRLIAFVFSSNMPSQDAQDRLFFAVDANLGRHDELRWPCAWLGW
jgi:hypothetical protein